MDLVAQVGIVAFGATAIWLVGRPEPWSRWGYVLGICSQPFWLWTSVSHRQWGIAVLTLWYGYSWGQGIWFRFGKRGTSGRP